MSIKSNQLFLSLDYRKEIQYPLSPIPNNLNCLKTIINEWFKIPSTIHTKIKNEEEEIITEEQYQNMLNNKIEDICLTITTDRNSLYYKINQMINKKFEELSDEILKEVSNSLNDKYSEIQNKVNTIDKLIQTIKTTNTRNI